MRIGIGLPQLDRFAHIDTSRRVAIAGEVVPTRDLGAHELIIDLPAQVTDPDELVDTALARRRRDHDHSRATTPAAGAEHLVTLRAQERQPERYP